MNKGPEINTGIPGMGGSLGLGPLDLDELAQLFLVERCDHLQHRVDKVLSIKQELSRRIHRGGRGSASPVELAPQAVITIYYPLVLSLQH